MSDETLMEFPCEFHVKVFGEDSEAFRETTLEIVRTHAGPLQADKISERSSAGGRYLALTYIITARSKQQLDELYQELTCCELVVMAL